MLLKTSVIILTLLSVRFAKIGLSLILSLCSLILCPYCQVTNTGDIMIRIVLNRRDVGAGFEPQFAG
jgi:hypothetical protein